MLTHFILLQTATTDAAQPTLMATIPASTISGIAEELRVLEDLSVPDAPIIFVGPTLRYSLTKTTEAQASDSDALWDGFGVDQVTSAEEDLLGNALTANGTKEPTYERVASVVPPVISSAPAYVADYELQSQTFIGSRITAQKHVFSPDGQKHNADSPLHFHLRPKALHRANASAGLLGGWLPAVRYRWDLTAGGFADTIGFAQAESTDDRPLHVASQQPGATTAHRLRCVALRLSLSSCRVEQCGSAISTCRRRARCITCNMSTRTSRTRTTAQRLIRPAFRPSWSAKEAAQRSSTRPCSSSPLRGTARLPKRARWR